MSARSRERWRRLGYNGKLAMAKLAVGDFSRETFIPGDLAVKATLAYRLIQEMLETYQALDLEPRDLSSTKDS